MTENCTGKPESDPGRRIGAGDGTGQGTRSPTWKTSQIAAEKGKEEGGSQEGVEVTLNVGELSVITRNETGPG